MSVYDSTKTVCSQGKSKGKKKCPSCTNLKCNTPSNNDQNKKGSKAFGAESFNKSVKY